MNSTGAAGDTLLTSKDAEELVGTWHQASVCSIPVQTIMPFHYTFQSTVTGSAPGSGLDSGRRRGGWLRGGSHVSSWETGWTEAQRGWCLWATRGQSLSDNDNRITQAKTGKKVGGGGYQQDVGTHLCPWLPEGSRAPESRLGYRYQELPLLMPFRGRFLSPMGADSYFSLVQPRVPDLIGSYKWLKSTSEFLDESSSRNSECN